LANVSVSVSGWKVSCTSLELRKTKEGIRGEKGKERRKGEGREESNGRFEERKGITPTKKILDPPLAQIVIDFPKDI
jgi:hypothetical protein